MAPPTGATTAGDGPARRSVLGAGTGAAALLGGCTHAASRQGGTSAAGSASPSLVAPEDTVRFYGERQAGIVTPPQTYARWVAADLRKGADRDDVVRLLQVWTDDISRLVDGRGPITDQAPELATNPHRLTITVGVGPRLLRAAKVAVPSWLKELPPFDIDDLDPRWGGGDLVLQICSDSAPTVSHAHRQLLTAGAGYVRQRWVQQGFREPVREESWAPTRNLFGQVDGTVQPSLDGHEDHLLFGGPEAGAWQDGSSLVLRRIAMNLDTWDEVDRPAREFSIGRRLDDGAPLTGGKELDPPDLSATDELGFPVIDPASHMRRAMPRRAHERFLRRPYTYEDAPSGTGDALTDAGLLFAAYQADPVRQFVPVQRRLAEQDLLNIWTTPVGSVVSAILPGCREGEWLGQRVLDA